MICSEVIGVLRGSISEKAQREVMEAYELGKNCLLPLTALFLISSIIYTGRSSTNYSPPPLHRVARPRNEMEVVSSGQSTLAHWRVTY